MQVAEPKTRRWNRQEYGQMADLGWFRGQRVELVGGEIVEMSPQRNAHTVTIGLVERALRAVFGDDHWIRIQAPLALSEESEPEPDLAVVPGGPRDYSEHPATALLVVEVSDTTVEYDAQIKASLYASAGIPDYWLVNLVNECVTVHRQPVADPAAPFGYRYDHVEHIPREGRPSALARPDAPIDVAALLP